METVGGWRGEEVKQDVQRFKAVIFVNSVYIVVMFACNKHMLVVILISMQSCSAKACGRATLF